MEDLDKIALKCAVSIQSDENKIRIQSRFTFLNRSVTGLLIIFLLGASLIILPFFMSGEVGAKIFLIVLGLLIFGIGAISIVIQTTNFIELKGNRLKYRYVLKTKTVIVSKEDNVKMKSKRKHVKRLRSQSGTDSYFRVVTIKFRSKEGKAVIFDYQVNEDYASEAKYFGKEIERMINQRINLI